MSELGSSAEHFSKNLRRIRHQQDDFLSQEKLADEIGVHDFYPGMLERGERAPSLETLDAIVEVLGVEPYELLMPPEEASDED